MEEAAADLDDSEPEALFEVDYPPKCSLANLSIKLVISCLSKVNRGRIMSYPEMHQSASLYTPLIKLTYLVVAEWTPAAE